MFKKLFGKKNDGFYLQLEDEKGTPAPAAKVKSAPPANIAQPAPVVTVPATVPVTPVANTQAVGAPVAVTAPAAVAETTASAEKAAKKSVKKSVKKTETDKKVEDIKAPIAAPVVVAPPITSFASDYLIKPSSNSSRRRPGANMNAFLDMARQAKKPEPFKK